MAMLSLKHDFPDIADEIVLVADSHAAMKDALIDYEHACRRLSDKRTRADDRALWSEIHGELVVEIRRIFVRLEQQENTT